MFKNRAALGNNHLYLFFCGGGIYICFYCISEECLGWLNTLEMRTRLFFGTCHRRMKNPPPKWPHYLLHIFLIFLLCYWYCYHRCSAITVSHISNNANIPKPLSGTTLLVTEIFGHLIFTHVNRSLNNNWLALNLKRSDGHQDLDL